MAAPFTRPAVYRARTFAYAFRPAEIRGRRDSLDGIAGSFRLSEPRSEVFKGFEQPVDVVAVDWR
jgi:hypothetical protein